MKNLKVSGLPDWMSEKINKKRGTVVLRGNSTWAGQPVINTVRVKLNDEITGINVDRAMMASWRFKGTDESNKFIFKSQAGAITKRTNSIINFGEDKVRDTFVFTNNTASHGPFNHMQRYVIKNFGKEDVVILKNIGKRFTFSDLSRVSGDKYILPGAPPTSLTIFS